ncbi:hypothetical protein P7K49_023802 [Saguinus oedipus]|uniref:Cytosol aminopeptidase domain-containing protein n=1 Tax=Saguinus oedipus TaxID=9490 RepID=A0ABQ9UMQ7_SAGOE|nr:hypothetical protein P7K49_023802 [Saguinus oedipus]
MRKVSSHPFPGGEAFRCCLHGTESGKGCDHIRGQAFLTRSRALSLLKLPKLSLAFNTELSSAFAPAQPEPPGAFAVPKKSPTSVSPGAINGPPREHQGPSNREYSEAQTSEKASRHSGPEAKERSDEPPVFLEIHYKGSPNANEPPLVFVGKGITFDSGGISVKASANMDLMRADMGGAATICSAIVSAAKLNLPINIIGLAPLCENTPRSKANKPGDVVRARNGKTIQVDNTDAEGRLILADALCYAHTFNPKVILNAATLTGAMDVALGSDATGVFTNSSWLWNKPFEASIETGDHVWRMPLFEHYTRQVVDCQLADVNNIGKYRSAGACTAAAFLKEFVTHPKWAHLDIAGMMTNKDEVPYLCTERHDREAHKDSHRVLTSFQSRQCLVQILKSVFTFCLKLDS